MKLKSFRRKKAKLRSFIRLCRSGKIICKIGWITDRDELFLKLFPEFEEVHSKCGYKCKIKRLYHEL